MRAVCQHTNEEIINYRLQDVTTAHCEKCGAIVRKSKYGADDECPNCGEWLEWNYEDEEIGE